MPDARVRDQLPVNPERPVSQPIEHEHAVDGREGQPEAQGGRVLLRRSGWPGIGDARQSAAQVISQ